MHSSDIYTYLVPTTTSYNSFLKSRRRKGPMHVSKYKGILTHFESNIDHCDHFSIPLWADNSVL